MDYITIPLSKRGKNKGKYEAIISIEDADLALLDWACHGLGYVIRKYETPENKRTTILLHRVILERILGRSLIKGEQVDHINGIKSDNRRENLRLATNSQNQANNPKYKNNKSGYKGVSWDRRVSKWRSRISINKKEIMIGYFDTAEDAHKAYCEKAKELFGEFARFE